MNRFDLHHHNVCLPDAVLQTTSTNVHRLPKVQGLTVNFGFTHRHLNNRYQTLLLVLALQLVTNRQPRPGRSRKNHLALQVRQGALVGVSVTLRGPAMFSLLEKLVLAAVYTTSGAEASKGRWQYQVRYFLEFPQLEPEFLLFRAMPPMSMVLNTDCISIQEQQAIPNRYGLAFGWK